MVVVAVVETVENVDVCAHIFHPSIRFLLFRHYKTRKPP